MTKNNIIEELQKLACGENRSEMAKLREVFDEVENTLASGVSREDVLKVLTKNGFSMSLKVFNNSIYRLRKERKSLTAQETNKNDKSTVFHTENELEQLDSKQKRERLADKYISKTNPLLESFTKEKNK